MAPGLSMKRQEKRRRKLRKQKEEARMLRNVTAALQGKHPWEVGEIVGHRFKPLPMETAVTEVLEGAR